MAKPNKTAAAFYAQRGPRPETVEARNQRFADSELARDIAALQAGDMSEDEFAAKYNP